MTTKELKELRQLKFEIQSIDNSIIEIREMLEAVTVNLSDPLSSKGTGDKIPVLVAKMVDLEKKLKKTKVKRIRQIEQLYNWISNIEDPLVKSIIIDRYINAYSWAKIAAKHNITPDAARMIATRFIKKFSKK